MTSVDCPVCKEGKMELLKEFAKIHVSPRRLFESPNHRWMRLYECTECGLILHSHAFAKPLETEEEE